MFNSSNIFLYLLNQLYFITFHLYINLILNYLYVSYNILLFINFLINLILILNLLLNLILILILIIQLKNIIFSGINYPNPYPKYINTNSGDI